MRRKLTEEQKETIKGLISNKVDVLIEDVQEKSKLKEDFGADSLDKVEIIMDIEKEFNVMIPDEEFEDVNTVSDLFKVVGRYI